MPVHTRIPLRGVARELSGARGLYAGVVARGDPWAIWYEGILYGRLDLPPEERERLLTLLAMRKEKDAGHVNITDLKPFGRGELKHELEGLAWELKLKKGETVHSRTLTHIVKVLRMRGWDARRESVRAALVAYGYSGKRI